MQRRRRSKPAPKDVFGSSQPAQPTKSSTRPRPPLPSRPRIQITPPSVPGAKSKDQQKPTTEKPNVVEPILEPPEDSSEPIDESEVKVEAEQQEEILEEQLLGKQPKQKKTLGLSKKEAVLDAPAETVEKPHTSTSQKARELIESSILRASKPVATPVTPTAKKIETPVAKPEVKPKTQRKFRNRVSSYQPANRARRLDRSRHMEYKYEMRGVLVDIGVPEEHRSSILATIWARGERQTTKEAKDFILEKMDEGIIDDEQHDILIKIVDGYTVRR